MDHDAFPLAAISARNYRDGAGARLPRTPGGMSPAFHPDRPGAGAPVRSSANIHGRARPIPLHIALRHQSHQAPNRSWYRWLKFMAPTRSAVWFVTVASDVAGRRAGSRRARINRTRRGHTDSLVRTQRLPGCDVDRSVMKSAPAPYPPSSSRLSFARKRAAVRSSKLQLAAVKSSSRRAIEPGSFNPFSHSAIVVRLRSPSRTANCACVSDRKRRSK